jgi:hypothetical protein
MTVAEAPTLSGTQTSPVKVFSEILEEMRGHYLKALKSPLNKSNKIRSFNLSRYSIPHSTQLEGNQEEQVKELMGDTVCQLQANTSNFTASTQEGVNTASTDFINSDKSDASVLSFKQKMDEQRNQALKASQDTINAAFDKAQELGNAHPQLQNGILSVTGTVVTGITQAAKFVSDIVVQVVGKVIDGLAKAWEWIKNSFSTALSSIGTFFSNIF